MSFESAIRWALYYVAGGLLFLGIVVWTILKADEPKRILVKWIITTPVLAFLIFFVAPMVGKGGYGGAFVGIPLTAVCGILLAIIWFQDVAGALASPISDLYDGGNVPPEPRPAYSVALARQKAGNYQGAVKAIQEQLQRFPADLEGHMLLAGIQAENLRQLDAAEATILNYCSQPDHPPRNVVFALYSLADWQLAIAKDRDAAERALRWVTQLFPNSEFETGAAQRIAHLATAAEALGSGRVKKFFVQEGVQNLGLLKSSETSNAPAPDDPGKLAQDYVAHLERHPGDTEMREKLAILYVDHYKRLDLAAITLEEILQHPHQPHAAKAHCLNRLADLQVRSGADYDTVKQTLERIIDLDPRKATAEAARRRLDLLKLELKARAPNSPVKMGEYEQNIGLTHARKIHDQEKPSRPTPHPAPPAE